jgi:hypothetical protein
VLTIVINLIERVLNRTTGLVDQPCGEIDLVPSDGFFPSDPKGYSIEWCIGPSHIVFEFRFLGEFWGFETIPVRTSSSVESKVNDFEFGIVHGSPFDLDIAIKVISYRIIGRQYTHADSISSISVEVPQTLVISSV